MRAFVAPPWRDFVAAAEQLAEGGPRAWLVLALALTATWLVYVPVHELMHAYGCLLAGGDVTRLEIAPEYGGALLARVFPFVVSGSEYAGQLTGFDTHGNDATYLATVLAPYLLTLFPGVALLQGARDPRRAIATAVRTGVALPLAFAPFVSLTGDYYEAGSIAVTRIAHRAGWLDSMAGLRSDDLFKLAAALGREGGTPADWTIVGASFVAGCLLALVTYHCGAWIARRVRHGARESTRGMENPQ